MGGASGDDREGEEGEEEERGSEDEGSDKEEDGGGDEGEEENREAGGIESDGGDVGEEDRVKESDHLLFSILSTLGTMCRECDLIGCSTGGGSSSLPVDMNSIWGQ